jgi:hypothetical protein
MNPHRLENTLDRRLLDQLPRQAKLTGASADRGP